MTLDGKNILYGNLTDNLQRYALFSQNFDTRSKIFHWNKFCVIDIVNYVNLPSMDIMLFNVIL